MGGKNWDEFAVSGVTESTPKNILLGAGTLYKDLKYDKAATKWTGTILGATSGGTKLTIKPEVKDIEVDGVLVKAKGLTVKTGETATIETNMVEFSKDWIKSIVVGKEGKSEDTRFDVIESNAHISDTDYIKNFAFVGFMADGTPTVIIFDFALCTSGLETEGKNKENAIMAATFECYAELKNGQTDKLPYHIYVAKSA